MRSLSHQDFCFVRTGDRFPPSRVNTGKVVKRRFYGLEQNFSLCRSSATKASSANCRVPVVGAKHELELKRMRRCQDDVAPKPNKLSCHVLSVPLTRSLSHVAEDQRGGPTEQITSAALPVCPVDGVLRRDMSTQGFTPLLSEA